MDRENPASEGIAESEQRLRGSICRERTPRLAEEPGYEGDGAIIDQPLRILIVDDIAALRAYATEMIERTVAEPHEISAVRDGAEAVGLSTLLSFDLIIMDISMPELNGIKAAKEIWRQIPTQKILFWSQYHREAYVRELGKIVPDEAVHGYVLKSEADERFVDALNAVLFDDVPYIDPIVRGVQTRLSTKENSLSDVEYEALMDLTCGLTDRAIAARRHISVRGVQNRLSMLLKKVLNGEDLYLRETASMEIFNARTRIIFECLKRGLIDPDSLSELDRQLSDWLDEAYHLEKV